MILATSFSDLGIGLASGLAFGAVGLLMLVLGWVMVDVLTPGKLSHLIIDEHNWNASALVGSNLLAIGGVVTTAIATSHDDFWQGIIESLGYGVLGVLLQALAFIVVDRLTPGHLGTILTSHKLHPAILISVGASLAMGAVIAAAIA